MPRTPDPAKQADLLKRCVEFALKTGSLDLRLETLADAVGTSARMLIYHFGSKEALHNALLAQLEVILRTRFSAFAAAARTSIQPRAGSYAQAVAAILAIWDELTAPQMRGLLYLSAELRYRALRGDSAARRVAMTQTTAWRKLLVQWGIGSATARDVLMLVEGATTDFLLTGDAGPGRKALARTLGRRG
jgi:AcrR family transcriptional regulator